MSNDAAPAVADGHKDAWSALGRQGYALTGDQSIGLPRKFRPNFSQTYFNDWTLRHDEGDFADRLRARDVIHYRCRDEGHDLQRHDSITITDRAGIGQTGACSRRALADRRPGILIHAFLQLVPPGRMQPDGTFGVNLFAFTNVVTETAPRQ